MTKQKPGLSREEHIKLGAELSSMRDRLGEIAVQLGHAYPVALGDLAISAQSGIDGLRSKLDDIVFREHPRPGTKDNISVYYPHGRDAKEAR